VFFRGNYPERKDPHTLKKEGQILKTKKEEWNYGFQVREGHVKGRGCRGISLSLERDSKNKKGTCGEKTTLCTQRGE